MELYVSNLSYEVDEAALQTAFAPFGQVRKVSVVKDRDSGQSRGFGFVDMPDEVAASRAIAALNGQELLGRPLKISEARARGSAPPASSRPMTASSPYARPASGGGARPTADPRPAPAPRSGVGPRPISAPRPASGLRPNAGGADFAGADSHDGSDRSGAGDELDDSARKLQRAKSLQKKKTGGGKNNKQFEDGSLESKGKRVKKIKPALPPEELDEDEELLDQFHLL